MGDINIGRVGIWTWVLDHVPSSRSVELAAEAEELGYGAIWYPEAAGRDPFVVAALLLQGTSSMRVAPGIANIYARDPVTTANAQRTIEGAFPGRFLLGLGVSHQHLVEGLRNHDYSRPLSYMREYLVRMREAPFFADGPQDLPESCSRRSGPRCCDSQQTPPPELTRTSCRPSTQPSRARPWVPTRRSTPSRW